MLHDATISFDEINYAEESKTFTAVFNRHMWENAKRRGIFRRMKIQAVHSKLTFENVLSMKINSEKKLYPINEVNWVEADGPSVKIHFHNDVVITLEIDKVSGNLEDLDQPWDIKGPFSISFGKD